MLTAGGIDQSWILEAQKSFCIIDAFCLIGLLPLYEMRTFAIDDPVAWALSVCHVGDCSYSFARWRHYDVAITALL